MYRLKYNNLLEMHYYLFIRTLACGLWTNFPGVEKETSFLKRQLVD